MVVINLGLPKSGTTTLQTALRKSGLNVVDHLMPGAGKYATAQALYDGYFSTGDPLTAFAGIQAIGEVSVLRPGLSLWPQMDFGLLTALRDRHPRVKFVATWRPAGDIVDSMARWRNLGTRRIPNGAIPGLPKGYGTPHHQETWITAHYQFLDQLFSQYSRYLRLDIRSPDAAVQLARHLGRDVPWWGRANENLKGAA